MCRMLTFDIVISSEQNFLIIIESICSLANKKDDVALIQQM